MSRRPGTEKGELRETYLEGEEAYTVNNTVKPFQQYNMKKLIVGLLFVILLAVIEVRIVAKCSFATISFVTYMSLL